MKTKKTDAIPVTAAGGVVYRQIEGQRELLLIYKNECWDLPKGHQDNNETIEQCAMREVSEETGVQELNIEDSLLTTAHTYQRNEQTYRKITYWFKMKASGNEKITPQTTEGIEKVRWIPAPQAQNIVGYNNLKKLLSDFQSTF